jgi:hypothetical protein
MTAHSFEEVANVIDPVEDLVRGEPQTGGVPVCAGRDFVPGDGSGDVGVFWVLLATQ